MRRLTFLLLILLLGIFGCNSGKPERSAPPQAGAPYSAIDTQKENTLKEILARDPKNLQALISLGNLTMDAERFNEAVDAYSKALEIDPANANVRVDMGTCYRRMGRPIQAVEAYKKALEYDPNHLNARLNMGVVLAYDLNKPGEAADSFQEYLKLNPNDPRSAELVQEIVRLRGLEKGGGAPATN